MKEFKTKAGTILPLLDIKGKDYLTVQQRVRWFREEHPDFSIETEFVFIKEHEAMAKAVIKDVAGRVLAMAHKVEDRKGFQDFCEKAETSAIGRALGLLGYGTQFATELEEGERLADAPQEKKSSSQSPTAPVQSLKQEQPTGQNTQKIQMKTSMTTSSTSEDAGDYVVTFGKHKNKTIRELVDSEGQYKMANYTGWLESDARLKKKELSQGAVNLIESFNAFVGNGELDKALKNAKDIDYSAAFEDKLKGNNEPPPSEDWDPNQLPF